ncbi:MAG: 23S rRNA (adenine(2503)-C(2))-methyltransferase RlmN [Pseudomonadota bacterium]
MTPTANKSRFNLLDYDRAGLQDLFVSVGEKPFRATQLMKWLYHEGISDFSEMTNLSLKLREKLAGMAEVRLPEVALSHLSEDGTWKWLFRLGCGNSIECVFIPEARRGTLCVSSQVGCALDCSFCATAREGFNRNLSTAEIVGQLYLASKLLRDHQPDNPAQITNVVFMGMGEPLANFDNVVRAMRLMLDDNAFGLSKRRVTLSTSGIVPAMYRLFDAVDAALAVSLHAPDDDLRDQLVPINRKYPIAKLLEACRAYVDGDRKKHVTFEYVMLHGVNDSVAQARALVRLIRTIPAKVNLIPFNSFDASGYQCSTPQAINAFRKILLDAGIVAVTRKTRGDDISAACGQLAGQIHDKSRRELKFTELRFGDQTQHQRCSPKRNSVNFNSRRLLSCI